MVSSQRRVVVTGIGIISPIGLDPASCWQSLRQGQSGIKPIQLFNAAALPVRIAGEIETKVELVCARCLEPVVEEVNRSFDLFYSPLPKGIKPEEARLKEDDAEIGIAVFASRRKLLIRAGQHRDNLRPLRGFERLPGFGAPGPGGVAKTRTMRHEVTNRDCFDWAIGIVNLA